MNVQKIAISLVMCFAMLRCEESMGQTFQLGDSLYRVFKNKPVFTVKLDSRNTFITGAKASIWGIKAGFVFRKTLTVGMGYNWLWNDVAEPFTYASGMVEMAEIKLHYLAPFIDYTFYRKGRWEVTLPIQIGAGTSFLRPSRIPMSQKQNKGFVLLYEPAMTFEYRLFKYVAVGGGYGYRIMLKNNRELSSRFTSPMYVLRFRVLFDELYKWYQNRQMTHE
jgi:hypothetical protein